MQDKPNKKISSEIPYPEMRRLAERGHLLIYNNASDEQLTKRQGELHERINHSTLGVGDFMRNVFLSTVYAGASISLSVWFAGKNIIDNVPKATNWLVKKGFLVSAAGQSYVPRVQDLQAEISELATEWARIYKVNAIDQVPVAELRGMRHSPYLALKKASRIIERLGMKDGSEVIFDFLENNTHRIDEVGLDEIRALSDEMKAAAKRGVEPFGVKILELYGHAERNVRNSRVYTADSAVDIPWVRAKIVEKTRLLFDMSGHNSHIFNRRIAPVAVGLGALGAAAVGSGALNAVREREAFMHSSELSHVERLLHDRNSEPEKSDVSLG